MSGEPLFFAWANRHGFGFRLAAIASCVNWCEEGAEPAVAVENLKRAAERVRKGESDG